MNRLPMWALSLVIAGAAMLVGLPGLGDRGLTNSEGHRVVPGLEILEGGDLFATTMFDTVYVRKPPGMFWAIAASSMLLGETEFAARLVSVLATAALALTTLVLASRWFGRAGGFASAITTVMMPALLSSVRSAEIESLNTALTGISALLLIDALVRLKGERLLVGVIAGVSAGLMVFTKGPAGLPVVLGALAGGAIGGRSWKLLWSRTSLGFFGGVLVVGGGLMWAWFRAIGISDEPRVLQGPSDFMFEPGRLGKIAALLPTAFAYALPGSLAMLFPWEARRLNEGDSIAHRAALALSVSWLLALGVLTVGGVSNPRYAQPAVPLAGACAGYLVWAVGAGVFQIPRRRIGARLCVLGHPGVWLVVMGGFVAGYLLVEEPVRRAESGRDVGRMFGERLADEVLGPTTVWSDWAIEARPEVLLELERAAGDGVNVRWAYGWDPRTIEGIGPGGYVVLREDAPNPAFESLGLARTRIERGRVKNFEFGLYRLD